MRKYSAIEVSCGDEVYNGLILDEPRYQNAQTAFAIFSLPYRKAPSKFDRYKRRVLEKAITTSLYVIIFYVLAVCIGLTHSPNNSVKSTFSGNRAMRYAFPASSVGETLFAGPTSKEQKSD